MNSVGVGRERERQKKTQKRKMQERFAFWLHFQTCFRLASDVLFRDACLNNGMAEPFNLRYAYKAQERVNPLFDSSVGKENS